MAIKVIDDYMDDLEALFPDIDPKSLEYNTKKLMDMFLLYIKKYNMTVLFGKGKNTDKIQFDKFITKKGYLSKKNSVMGYNRRLRYREANNK